MTSTVILQIAVCVFFSLMVYGMREVRILRSELRDHKRELADTKRELSRTEREHSHTERALDKAVKHIYMAHDEIEYLEDKIPCECPDEEAGCASVNCASQRKCECNFKAAQWHGCGIKGCKRPCLECDGQCGAVGTEECKYP